MSTAELRAHTLYRDYQLASLEPDVKHCLILLLGGLPAETSKPKDSSLPCYTLEELHEQALQNTEDILAGKGRPIDELFDELEYEYPQLCK